MFVPLLAQVILNINLNFRCWLITNLHSVQSTAYYEKMVDVKCLPCAIGKDLKNKTFITNDYFVKVYFFVKGGKRIVVDLLFRNWTYRNSWLSFDGERPKLMWRHMKIRNSNMEINLTNDSLYEHDRSIKLLNLNSVEGSKSDLL